MNSLKKFLSLWTLLSAVILVSCQYQGGQQGGPQAFGHHGYGQEAQYGAGYGEKRDYYAPPHYAYEYNVHDPHTGDLKAQKETRQGDVVKGFYALREADGTLREVHYTADHHNGFNAQVKRTGQAYHPQVYGQQKQQY